MGFIRVPTASPRAGLYPIASQHFNVGSGFGARIFFYGCTHRIWKFPSQRLTPSHTGDISHSCSNTSNSNPLCQLGMEPASCCCGEAAGPLAPPRERRVASCFQKPSMLHHSSFPLRGDEHSMVWLCHVVFIRVPLHVHWGRSHLQALVICTALYIRIQIAV